MTPLDGQAIVYCQGAFNTPNGKTAHGLVRRTLRYRVLSVVDSTAAGEDAGVVLEGKHRGIPVVASIEEALRAAQQTQQHATHLVIGLAPDGGRLSGQARADVKAAVKFGLNVDCGLHDFLTEDAEIVRLAAEHKVTLRDIRRTPSREHLHSFTGKIEEVTCAKIAVLGTDSAVGKRTTAWTLVDVLERMNHRAQFIGTGQTAWLQGAQYCMILDSMINDFLAGELEHVVWSAWHERKPDVVVIEGQGSLMNPAYPGGYEILAAARPDAIVLQHAPARREYDGFPGYPIHPLTTQIDVLQRVSGKPVVAVTVNHEHIETQEIPKVCAQITRETGLPAHDVLHGGAQGLYDSLAPHIRAAAKAAKRQPAATG